MRDIYFNGYLKQPTRTHGFEDLMKTFTIVAFCSGGTCKKKETVTWLTASIFKMLCKVVRFPSYRSDAFRASTCSRFCFGPFDPSYNNI